MIPPDPGSYAVWDGRRLRFYSAADDTYSLQRVSEPHDTFSILNVLAWDGPGEGRWAGSCAEGQGVGRETVAGRAALHVACPEAGPLGAPVDLWVDVETGLVLKIDATAAPGASLPFRSPFGPAPGGTLEVIDVEYRPAFADDELTFVPPEGSEPAGEVSPGPATGLAIGEGVPTWVLPALGGGTIDLASLRGEPTLVYVWATWCPPCADGEVSGAADPLAVFDDAWLQHGASVTFVAVAHRDDEPIVARFVDQRGYSVPIALDTSGEALAAWGVEGIPLLVVLDAEGALAGAYLGDLRGPDVRAIVEAVTAGDPLPSVGGKTVEQLPS